MDVRIDVDGVVEDIDRQGYVIREGVLDDGAVATMRAELDPLLAATPTGRNPFEGYRTRRLYSPLAKTRVLDDLVLDPGLEQLATALIGPHTLSSIIGIDIGPGEVAQEIHYDAAAYPLPRTHREVVFNTMWALDDFTVDNGATVVLPGSNRWEHTTVDERTRVVQAEMPAGSVLIWTGKTLHGGGANHTDRWRLGLVIEFVAGWLRTHENIQASIPPALARELPPRLQELIGYHLYPDFLGYVDGRHPRKVLTAGC
ncbi:MAG: phytanoyl-CoA dioxygenase family protein [Acidimicrobiia bacterium]